MSPKRQQEAPLYLNLDTSTSVGAYEKALSKLGSEDVVNKVGRGALTIGIIRPHAEDSVALELLDRVSVYEKLEESIQDVAINTKLTMTLDTQCVRDMYQDVIDLQTHKSPESFYVMSNRWNEFLQLMTSGESTVLILESSADDAVGQWRRQLGHWNIEAHRDLNTLRGRFGRHNHNNLYHGSDSAEAVLRELLIIKQCIERGLQSAVAI